MLGDICDLAPVADGNTFAEDLHYAVYTELKLKATVTAIHLA